MEQKSQSFGQEDRFAEQIKTEKKEKKEDFKAEINLSRRLSEMCRDFTYEDYIKVRSSRDWESFDKLTGAEKMLVRIQEVQEYMQSKYE